LDTIKENPVFSFLFLNASMPNHFFFSSEEKINPAYHMDGDQSGWLLNVWQLDWLSSSELHSLIYCHDNEN